jgi:hypothetical protein
MSWVERGGRKRRTSVLFTRRLVDEVEIPPEEMAALGWNVKDDDAGARTSR